MSTIKEKSNRLKQYLEELNLQMHLGANELDEEWEKQKAQLKSWSEENLNEINKTTSDANKRLHERFDRIRTQAALGKAEGTEEVKRQKAKILGAIDDLDKELEELSDDGSEKWDETKAYFQRSSEILKAKLEFLRYEYTLGKAEAKDDWKKFKEDMKEKTSDWKAQIDKESEEAKTKWSHFKSELGESFGHFKKAFKSE